MAALEIFLFPVRIVQGIFAIIVLGTLAFSTYIPFFSPSFSTPCNDNNIN
jgi:hypothetical protein